MDFQLNGKQLPAPRNIEISSSREAFNFVLTWDQVLNPDAELTEGSRITNVSYNIYRSASINGIYYRLNTDPTTENHYHLQVNKNPDVNNFFKVSTVATFDDGSTSEGILSAPVTFMVPNTNKWFNKINQRNRWILSNTGVLMDLYIRKFEGERCSCYNPAYGQGDGSCPICFGTTFKGGYDPVYQIWIREKPTDEQLSIENQGYVIQRQTGAWTISKTLIKTRDVLINPQGIIYSVLSSNVNSSAGFYFHQELSIKEVDPTDILYNLSRQTLTPEY